LARIRSIKPEFWDDRKLARMASRDARLLYIALWNLADEHGRLNGDPQWIKGQVFPYDDDINPSVVACLLSELEEPGLAAVVAYTAGGDPYLLLPKLARHQRLEPEKVKSRIPAPPEAPCAHESAPRADEPESRADSSALLYGAGSMEHVAGSRGVARGPDRADPGPPPPRRPDASGLHELPGDFAPTDGMRRWANATYPGLDLHEETAQFCRYWRSEGRRKKSWPDAWQKWIADSHKRMAQSSRASPRQQETDEIFDAAMQRARAREESGNDPHGNGDALPLRQGALPAAGN
jgi:hypothetical protein